MKATCLDEYKEAGVLEENKHKESHDVSDHQEEVEVVKEQAQKEELSTKYRLKKEKDNLRKMKQELLSSQNNQFDYYDNQPFVKRK